MGLLGQVSVPSMGSAIRHDDNQALKAWSAVPYALSCMMAVAISGTVASLWRHALPLIGLRRLISRGKGLFPFAPIHAAFLEQVPQVFRAAPLPPRSRSRSSW